MSTENNRLNLMIVCGSVAYGDVSSGGSEISLRDEIENMEPEAKQIEIITLPKLGSPSIESVGAITTVHRVDVEDVPSKIVNIHEDKFDGNTDWIITQLLLCDIAIESAKALRIPTIYYARSTGSKLDMSIGGQYHPDISIAVSIFMANEFEAQYGWRPYISYPTFNHKEDIIGDENILPIYDFLMFNPNKSKGGDVFFEMAERFPNSKFLAVSGWTDLKKDGKFDSSLMQLMAKAHGEVDVLIPNEPEAPPLPNLTVIQPQRKVGNIIRSARAVLVPSQWDEAFGRVIVEAGMNDRIVFASNNGGTSESMHIAGMPENHLNNLLVNDFNSVDAWEEALNWFLDNEEYIPNPKPQIPKPVIGNILKTTSLYP